MINLKQKSWFQKGVEKKKYRRRRQEDKKDDWKWKEKLQKNLRNMEKKDKHGIFKK